MIDINIKNDLRVMSDMPDTKGLLILFAEPNLESQFRIHSSIESEGWQLLCVENSCELESTLKSVIPDIIVIDFSLAKNDKGLLLQWLKSSIQFNNIPIIIVSSQYDTKSRTLAIKYGADVFLTKPVLIPNLVSNIKFLVKKEKIQNCFSHFDNHLEKGWYWNIKHLHAVFTQMEYCNDRTLEDLSQEAQAPDQGKSRQLQCIAIIIEMLALKLQLDELTIENMRQTACLHDIGNAAIPKKIFSKNGLLAKTERHLISKHTEVGCFILEDSRLPPIQTGKVMAASHHEWWNGEGYPNGLHKEDIPIEGRICAVADAFDALTSDRPYRKAFGVGEAIRIIEEQSGSQFDPYVVRAFSNIKDSLYHLGRD